MAEDFTTYTEVDPNNHITVIAPKVAWNGLSAQESAYVYFDKGVDFFNSNLTHTLEVEGTSYTGLYGRVIPWQLANQISDFRPMFTDKKRSIGFYFDIKAPRMILFEIVEGSNYFADASTLLNPATLYYLTIIRDEAIGSFGQLQCFIYSNSAKTVLVDTLTLSLNEKADFRYVYALNTDNFGNATTSVGYMQNLDLGEIPRGLFRRGLGRGLNRGIGRGL